MFKHPFSFSGRIRRTEYALSFLIYFIFAYILHLFIDRDKPIYDLINFISIMLYIPLLWLIFAQGAKRCHDRGNKGWFQIIPFYGFLMLFAAGQIGINKYGTNPKGIGNIDDIDEIGNYLTK